MPTDDDRLNLTDVHFVHDEEPQRLAVSDPRAGNESLKNLQRGHI